MLQGKDVLFLYFHRKERNSPNETFSHFTLKNKLNIIISSKQEYLLKTVFFSCYIFRGVDELQDASFTFFFPPKKPFSSHRQDVPFPLPTSRIYKKVKIEGEKGRRNQCCTTVFHVAQGRERRASGSKKKSSFRPFCFMKYYIGIVFNIKVQHNFLRIKLFYK